MNIYPYECLKDGEHAVFRVDAQRFMVVDAAGCLPEYYFGSSEDALAAGKTASKRSHLRLPLAALLTKAAPEFLRIIALKHAIDVATVAGKDKSPVQLVVDAETFEAYLKGKTE